MPRRIYKYHLDIADTQTIEVPAGAEFLTAQMQRGQLYVWAIVDTDRLFEKEYFVIVGTGHPMPEKPKLLQFIATVQQEVFVWHVFRAIK